MRTRSSIVLVAAVAALASLGLAACGRVAGWPATERVAASDIRRVTLQQPDTPPEIVAGTPAEAAAVASALTSERLEALVAPGGGRRLEGAQLPLLAGSTLGRAYLAAGSGRALAQGRPAETCPAFGVELAAADAAAATRIALERCLEALPEGAACGCRALAAGEVALAPAEAFVYARGVAATLIGSGLEATLIAEERLETEAPDAAALVALAAGARRYWLLGPSGPAAALDIAADGSARLTLVSGPRESLTPGRVFVGPSAAEGFRRGRLARVARLREVDAEGAPLSGAAALTLLLGYEPAELETRRADLEARAAAL